MDFVQGAFLKLLVNSDLRFELKQEQRIAVNCQLEGRDVFAVMPTGSVVKYTTPTVRDICTSLSLFVFITCLLAGLRSGVETDIGSWHLFRVTLPRSSTSSSSWLVTFFISRNSLHKFLILRARGRQTRSDKFGDLINTTPMFLDIEAKTSPRLPSRFEAMYKFYVDIIGDQIFWFHT